MFLCLFRGVLCVYLYVMVVVILFHDVMYLFVCSHMETILKMCEVND